MSALMGAIKMENSTLTTTKTPDKEQEVILRFGRAVMGAESAAIADAESRLDSAFVRAVQALLNTRGRVCVTGVGKAGLIGQKKPGNTFQHGYTRLQLAPR